ncbi:MAG TPA: hypothetical protein ENK18_16445 [Deltaproteobacteria bacterium]|nr:hypothetical protein [Deltaproteobacteria bacterium]
MRICRRCGVHAPPQSVSCEECGAELGVHAREIPMAPLLFAALKLEFECRGCGLWAPLNHFEGMGMVCCVRCQLEQRFEDDGWRAVLGLCHAVSDLMGAEPEGRKVYNIAIDEVNPFASSGKRHSGIRVDPSSSEAFATWLPANLRAWVAPGHPVGSESGEPLDVRAPQAGTIQVRSSRGEAAGYRIGSDAMRLHPGWLGAIAPAHAQGPQPGAHPGESPSEPVIEAGAPIVCRGCGAPLRLDGSQELVHCDHCGGVVRVPEALRAVRAVRAVDPEPVLWWLVFEGRAPYRKFLERDPRTRGHSGDRSLEPLPDATMSSLERFASVSWFVIVPTTLLASVAVLSRLPSFVAWLTLVLSGEGFSSI